MVVRRKIDEKRDKLRQVRQKALLGGGDRRIEAQHDRGKLTARERIHLLLDENSFEELDPFVKHQSYEFGLENQRILGDAVVTGFGKINERIVCVYAQDFTVLGGSLSEAVSQKICKVMDHALAIGAPVIGLIDSGGARIQEGIESLAGYGDIFLRNVRASGIIPQISAIVGPAAGGATYSPALTDFVFMVESIGQMYITGPDVIKAVTGEEISHEHLGGALSHSTKSGVAHFTYDSEHKCLNHIRRLMSFLPQNNLEETSTTYEAYYDDQLDESLAHIVPVDANQPYDMLHVINKIVDEGDFMSIQSTFAPNIIIGFARIAGRSVGVVANQPDVMAGVLDINASTKAARFVRFCDAFNIPLLTLIDVPGFMPGIAQEYGGIIRHGAKLIYAYAEATVPKISILTRKAYGGAYIVMSSKSLNGDVNFSWPTGEVAVMGAEGAVNIIYRKELENSKDPEALRTKLVDEYKQRLMNPYVAANKGMMDNVIDPPETRLKIIRALEMLENKRDAIPYKKHGNIPL